MTRLIAKRQRDHGWRAAFTLVELLAVIAVIGILASMVLFALYGVLESTRADATRSQITRIDGFLRDQWDEYKTRQVNVRFVYAFFPPNTVLNTPGPVISEQEFNRRANGVFSIGSWVDERHLPYGRFLSYVRLAALREMMRMELPNHKSDLLTPAEIRAGAPPFDAAPPPSYTSAVLNANDPRTNLGNPWTIVRSGGNLNAPVPSGSPASRFLVQLDSIPAVWHAYRAKADSLARRQFGATANWRATWTPEHETAECLYLILSMMGDEERSALSYFNESRIGDIDNDGMPEIHDAWGVPIVWVRWPAGFVKQYENYQYPDRCPTDVNPNCTATRRLVSTIPYSDLLAGDSGWLADGLTGGGDDPLDPLKSDLRWYDAACPGIGAPIAPPLLPAPPCPDSGNITVPGMTAWSNDPFALMPLVFSAGADKVYDIVLQFPTAPHAYYAMRVPSTSIPPGVGLGTIYDGILIPNDPYFGRAVPTDPLTGGPRLLQFGSVLVAPNGTTGAGDNLTNHYVEVSSP